MSRFQVKKYVFLHQFAACFSFKSSSFRYVPPIHQAHHPSYFSGRRRTDIHPMLTLSAIYWSDVGLSSCVCWDFNFSDKFETHTGQYMISPEVKIFYQGKKSFFVIFTFQDLTRNFQHIFSITYMHNIYFLSYLAQKIHQQGL